MKIVKWIIRMEWKKILVIYMFLDLIVNRADSLIINWTYFLQYLMYYKENRNLRTLFYVIEEDNVYKI